MTQSVSEAAYQDRGRPRRRAETLRMEMRNHRPRIASHAGGIVLRACSLRLWMRGAGAAGGNTTRRPLAVDARGDGNSRRGVKSSRHTSSNTVQLSERVLALEGSTGGVWSVRALPVQWVWPRVAVRLAQSGAAAMSKITAIATL
jgi:hypothetical protein